MRQLALCYLVILLLAGCDVLSPGRQGLPETLVVVTRNAPTTWYQGREEPEGPELDLVRSFAEQAGIDYRFEIVDSISEVLDWIQSGKAHIAAAGLTHTEQREQQGLVFGPPYATVQQQVVCRRQHGDLPETVADLVGKRIEVIADSSYVERLNELKLEVGALTWDEVQDMGTEQLLERVWNREIDCTIADSNIVSINRRYFPELVVAFPFSEEQSLAWVVADDWRHLVGDLETWLEQITSNGQLAAIDERYYGHVELFDYVDMRKFVTRIEQRLPKYVEDFRRVAGEHGLDWMLLAAQAYQESHWNPKAKSPTGVRGIMMLTLATAKQMGVKSRLDPRQSIEGGARYLARMLGRIPESVEGDNRLWFALAAYNVGFGHLRDARKLAESLGRNPDVWFDLKEVLPLLSQKKYYKTLQYGYARGSEPVRYVQRIREYHQVLQRKLAPAG